ncbi:MAG: DNA-directed RNA polymerase subunit alpha [Microscillaceae bacterium]|nr:DNA-directed RNA polymerase subunit alpha [Microscillaceae bacterium]MDW8461812.1 DNA-directed RNA polymerase subunit alpha [Cytophagales bacterium]
MSLLTFQMPEKVVMDKTTDFQGKFEFKPLERGYGVTIGHALRRVLLSSLEGYAIVCIRIPGVLHEFSTIKGVMQDVSEIILNLKQVRFKKISDVVENKITVFARNQDVLRAGDIGKFTSTYKILNPELVICNLDESVDLEIELIIDKGRGYVPSEEQQLKGYDQTLGYIPIDAIFTPIKNVQYTVENTRVEQRTDYEKLILEIKTDGSIHPEDALKGAANILIKHFMLFADQNIITETAKKEEAQEVDEQYLQMRKVLKTPISDLGLSVRAYNCLKSADIKTLGDLVKLEIADMMKFRNFGKKSLTELEQIVAERNLQFGMDVSKYNLDED